MATWPRMASFLLTSAVYSTWSRLQRCRVAVDELLRGVLASVESERPARRSTGVYAEVRRIVLTWSTNHPVWHRLAAARNGNI